MRTNDNFPDEHTQSLGIPARELFFTESSAFEWLAELGAMEIPCPPPAILQQTIDLKCSFMVFPDQTAAFVVYNHSEEDGETRKAIHIYRSLKGGRSMEVLSCHYYERGEIESLRFFLTLLKMRDGRLFQCEYEPNNNMRQGIPSVFDPEKKGNFDLKAASNFMDSTICELTGNIRRANLKVIKNLHSEIRNLLGEERMRMA